MGKRQENGEEAGKRGKETGKRQENGEGGRKTGKETGKWEKLQGNLEGDNLEKAGKQKKKIGQ